MGTVTKLHASTNNKHDEDGFLLIRHDRIVRFEEQPRTYFPEESIKELSESIRAEGQHTPVQLCKTSGGKGLKSKRDENGNPLFTLIDGERRWRACTLLANEAGEPFLMKATVEIVDSVEEHFRRSFGANFQREDMTPLDIAAGLLRLREGPDKPTYEQLAKSYGKSVAYIINYLSLNNLDDRVKAMMSPDLPKRNRLRVSHAIQIAKVRNGNRQLQFAEEVLEFGLSIMDLSASVNSSGLTDRSSQSYEDSGFYQPRSRRASDERAILTNLLNNTNKKLERFVERIDKGDMDMEDMYLSCHNGDEVFENYLELLSSIAKSVRRLHKAMDEALNN